MESGYLLLRSQKSLTGSCPEPDEFSPCYHIAFLQSTFNINLPTTPTSPKWCLAFRFSYQNSVWIPHHPHSNHMTSQLIHYPNSTRSLVEHASFLLVTYSYLGANIFQSSSQTSVIYVFASKRPHFMHTQSYGITVLYILTSSILESSRKLKNNKHFRINSFPNF